MVGHSIYYTNTYGIYLEKIMFSSFLDAISMMGNKIYDGYHSMSVLLLLDTN